MAQLGNLLVTGSSRLLGKLFCEDISVGNSLTVKTLSATNFTATNITTSGLTVNGNATTTGTLNVGNSQANGKISINGKVSIRDYVNNGWLGINDTGAWTSGVYFGSSVIRTDGGFQIGGSGKIVLNTSSAKFSVPVTINNSLAANNITATNVMVNDTLKAFKYELNTIQDLGGEFCVAPTIYIQSGATVNVSKASATTITVSIKDTESITSDTIQGIRWSASSKIKFQGKIDGVAIRCNGIMVSKLNTDANTMALTLTVDSGIADHFATAINGATYSDISVMLYQRYGKKVGATDNVYSPVGIRMSAYGSANSAPYVDIWGNKSNSDPDTIYTIPSVRLGYLDGLSTTLNGTTVKCVGYGLYADNVYLNGTIMSQSGSIGGFKIDNNSLTNGGWGVDNSVMICTGTSGSKAIGGSDAINGWCFSAGSKFGVTKIGNVYATGGKIGGFTISDYNLKGNNIGLGASNGHDCAFWAGASTGESAPFHVGHDGALYASNVNISGEITATSGNISGWIIGDESLYSGTDSMSSTNVGIYLGIDGIRQYKSNNQYIDMHDGQLKCVGASIDGSIVTSNIEAIGGTIGGWTIEQGKLYAGDGSSENPVAVVQYPRTGNLWTFAVGGTSHTNYSDCPFRVSKDGKMAASWANLAGWTITDGKIYSGDPTNSGEKVSVMQIPTANTTWTFATGGTSHANYSDCPFRVSKDGHVFGTEVCVGADDDTKGRASTLITNMGITINVNNSTTNYGLIMEQTGSSGNPYFGVTLQGKLFARSSSGFCQKGAVVCKATANTPTKTSVTFSSAFSAVPTVVVTPISAQPGTYVKCVSVSNVTTKGFDIYLNRTDSNSTSVAWIAML